MTTTDDFNASIERLAKIAAGAAEYTVYPGPPTPRRKAIRADLLGLLAAHYEQGLWIVQQARHTTDLQAKLDKAVAALEPFAKAFVTNVRPDGFKSRATREAMRESVGSDEFRAAHEAVQEIKA